MEDEEIELDDVVEGREDPEEETSRELQGVELALWCRCLGCKSGNMILGTRDWEGKGMLGDDSEDFRLDLSGLNTVEVTALEESGDKSCDEEPSSSSR